MYKLLTTVFHSLNHKCVQCCLPDPYGLTRYMKLHYFSNLCVLQSLRLGHPLLLVTIVISIITLNGDTLKGIPVCLLLLLFVVLFCISLFIHACGQIVELLNPPNCARKHGCLSIRIVDVFHSIVWKNHQPSSLTTGECPLKQDYDCFCIHLRLLSDETQMLDTVVVDPIKQLPTSVMYTRCLSLCRLWYDGEL